MKFTMMAAVLAVSGVVVCQAQAQVPAQVQTEWPKSIITANGTAINFFQPQVLSYSADAGLMKFRFVISVMDSGADEPIFGTAWVTATVTKVGTSGGVAGGGAARGDGARDVAAGGVGAGAVVGGGPGWLAGGGDAADAVAGGGQLEIQSVRVDELRIPGDNLQAENDIISASPEIYIPLVVKSLPEKQVAGSLELGRQETALAHDSAGVAPVKILFATSPAALVLIDGEPRLARNERWGLDAVVNTRSVIVHGSDGNFYLYGGNRWYLAQTVTGPYAPLNSRWKPRGVLRQVENDLKTAARKEDVEIPGSSAPVYTIMVRTEPAALIQSDGPPEPKELEGTSLTYVGNSNDNIFYDWGTRVFYVSVGSQWYKSENMYDSLGWSAVRRADLPVDLLLAMNEPITSNLAPFASRAKAENLVGKSALLDEDVPRVAKIFRSATTTIDYSGAPWFKPILGTQLKYATNTCAIVIEDHGTYYALDNGVWFVAASPIGLWRVSDTRPVGVELIPLRYSAYRAKFVYIYQVAPDYVYEGYLPGYLAGAGDGCALSAAYDEDWMDEAWGYDVDFIWGWGAGWYNGYFRFDRLNRYYGYVKYEGRRPGWREKYFGPGAKRPAGGLSGGGGIGVRGYASASGVHGYGGGIGVNGRYVSGYGSGAGYFGGDGSRGDVGGGRFAGGGGGGSRGYGGSGGGGAVSRGYTGGGGGSRGFAGGSGGSRGYVNGGGVSRSYNGGGSGGGVSRSYSGGGSVGGGGGGGGAAAHVSSGGGSSGGGGSAGGGSSAGAAHH